MTSQEKFVCAKALKKLLANGLPLPEEFNALECRLGFASVMGAMSAGISKAGKAEAFGTIMTYLSIATDEEILELVRSHNKHPAKWRSN